MAFRDASFRQSEARFVPVSTYPRIFSETVKDKTNIYVPLNPVHDVTYLPQFGSQKIQVSRSQTSLLNERQKVAAFKPATTIPKFFQKGFQNFTLQSQFKPSRTAKK